MVVTDHREAVCRGGRPPGVDGRVVPLREGSDKEGTTRRSRDHVPPTRGVNDKKS